MTVTSREVLCGTELQIVQEVLLDVIPVEMCYPGWPESQVELARVVELEIPDNG